jgi:hypothetical protein
MRQRHELLATPSGMARCWSMGAPTPHPARAAFRSRPVGLVQGVFGRSQCPRAQGGEATSPNPTDRGKSGAKRHVVVERMGIPLAIRHTGANVHDSLMLEVMVDAIVPSMVEEGHASGQLSSMPIRPMMLHAAQRPCAGVASTRASLDEGWTLLSVWAATAG